MTLKYSGHAPTPKKSIRLRWYPVPRVMKATALVEKCEGAILPHIVLVIDGFADLMMTVQEKPNSARNARTEARAIGIQLILVTQRPSVNVICNSAKHKYFACGEAKLLLGP